MRLIIDFTFETIHGEKGEATQLIDCEPKDVERIIKAGGYRSIEITEKRGAR